MNVPGICGLAAGMAHIQRVGLKAIGAREEREMEQAVRGLNRLGLRVLQARIRQACCLFLPPDGDCEKKAAGSFAARGLPCGLGYTVHRRPMRAPERWRLGRSSQLWPRCIAGANPGLSARGSCHLGPEQRTGGGTELIA